MTTPFCCPDCGAPLDLDERAETEDEIWRRGTPGVPQFVEKILRTCVVAFCTGCEFAIEVER